MSDQEFKSTDLAVESLGSSHWAEVESKMTAYFTWFDKQIVDEKQFPGREVEED